METHIERLKEKIKEAINNPSFRHRSWFVKWHLEIAEEIALELCEIYKEADKSIAIIMVWIHDYAKILDYDKEHDKAIMSKGGELLKEIGFSNEFADKIMDYLDIFESKMTEDLSNAPIEVQIASSADAASHLVGPFMPIYWYENSNKTIEQLMEDNIYKFNKDWHRKVTIPEVKKNFQSRHDHFMEMAGNLPNKFLN